MSYAREAAVSIAVSHELVYSGLLVVFATHVHVLDARWAIAIVSDALRATFKCTDHILHNGLFSIVTTKPGMRYIRLRRSPSPRPLWGT